ncbi:MAG: hypothetical protein IPH31_23340 [Lewinellaceae bacterium]|nr:hypothetical protein [Lewinellaceae bacterium]
MVTADWAMPLAAAGREELELFYQLLTLGGGSSSGAELHLPLVWAGNFSFRKHSAIPYRHRA